MTKVERMNKVVEHLKNNDVKCKVIKDDREEYGDFIAIFSYGKLTRQDIVKQIKDNGLLCLFFDGIMEGRR